MNPGWIEICKIEENTPGWYLFCDEAVEVPVPYFLDENLDWYHLDFDGDGDNPYDPEYRYTHYMPVPKLRNS